jgi:DNA-binding NarL/FixJ family response regulator
MNSPAATPITVLVERFEDLLDRGLRQVIDGDSSLEILAHDIEHSRLAVTLRALRPRVAILDVDALSSLAEVRHFSETFPGTQLVLIVSHATTPECVQALAFGASAFLGRDTQARDVLTAIHLAARGMQLIPRADHVSVVSPPPGPQLLTAREAQLLPMLQRGSSNAEIAVQLHIGVETVRTHVRNIYRKLGVASRRELAAIPSRAADARGAVELALPVRRGEPAADTWARHRRASRR